MQILQSRAKQIGDYQFNACDKIGSGFSSQVYKGRHANKDQIVAVKAIEMKRSLNAVEKQLLENQVKALRTLSHPNIISLFQILQTKNNLYIITELCDQDLAVYIKEKGPFQEVQSLTLLQQIASAFANLAEFKIVHRDAKPSNIFLLKGVVKLADFGFCQFIENRSPNTPFYNVGSPKYMSPQAYKKNIYSQKSDVWGVGMIYLEMLHGKLPFEGMQYDEMIKSIATGKAYTTLDISGFSKMLLSRMLSIDLERRVDFKQLLKFLNERPTNLTPVTNSPMVPMNRIVGKQDKSYRNSLVGNAPATTKAQRNIISKENNGHNDLKSNQCIFIEATIVNQPNCFPSKNREIQFKQKEKQLKKYPKSYHQAQSFDPVNFKRPISYTHHVTNHQFPNKNPLSPIYSKIPAIDNKKLDFKAQQMVEQIEKQPKKINFELKIQQLLKIISMLHSDPRLRINSCKIKLLKLVYSLAIKILNQRSQKQRRNSAQLANLQIILKGYMFLDSEIVAQNDEYYQHISSNIGQLSKNIVFPYLSFWTFKCLGSYLSDFEKQWNFKDLHQNAGEAKDFFNKIRMLFIFHQTLNNESMELKDMQGLQNITFEVYKRIVNGVKQIKY